MDQKIISFSVDEIAVDTDNVNEAINEACTKRRHHYWVRGICQLETRVYFMLLPVTKGHDSENYRISELSEIDNESFVNEINERYQGGFDTVGSFRVYDSIMMLYARLNSKR